MRCWHSECTGAENACRNSMYGSHFPVSLNKQLGWGRASCFSDPKRTDCTRPWCIRNTGGRVIIKTGKRKSKSLGKALLQPCTVHHKSQAEYSGVNHLRFSTSQPSYTQYEIRGYHDGLLRMWRRVACRRGVNAGTFLTDNAMSPGKLVYL
jgi:hypothetical protein